MGMFQNKSSWFHGYFFLCLSVRLSASAANFSEFLYECKRPLVGKYGREKVHFLEGKLEESKCSKWKMNQTWPKSVFQRFSLQWADQISIEMFWNKKSFFDSMIDYFSRIILDYTKANAHNPV